MPVIPFTVHIHLIQDYPEDAASGFIQLAFHCLYELIAYRIIFRHRKIRKPAVPAPHSVYICAAAPKNRVYDNICDSHIDGLIGKPY